MAGLRFEWDPRKAAANLAKHGVAFEEAATAFSDEAGLILRLISARRANQRERIQYRERNS